MQIAGDHNWVANSEPHSSKVQCFSPLPTGCTYYPGVTAESDRSTLRAGSPLTLSHAVHFARPFWSKMPGLPAATRVGALIPKL